MTAPFADRPDPMAYGRGLPRGFGVNLLVPRITPALDWQTEVLGAQVPWREELFAILAAQGATWFLHADAAYGRHPVAGIAQGAGTARGAGVELRLYGRDPDVAEAAANRLGTPVLATAADRPHGLREAFLLDPCGYLWVPCRPVAD